MSRERNENNKEMKKILLVCTFAITTMSIVSATANIKATAHDNSSESFYGYQFVGEFMFCDADQSVISCYPYLTVYRNGSTLYAKIPKNFKGGERLAGQYLQLIPTRKDNYNYYVAIGGVRYYAQINL